MIPVFIGGTGRSGTSILKRVLAAHPSMVAIPDELRITIDPDGALDLFRAVTDDWSPYAADHAIRRFRDMAEACARQSLASRATSAMATALGLSPRRYGASGLGRDFGEAFYRRRLARLIDRLVHHRAPGHWIGSPSYRPRPVIQECDPHDAEAAATAIASFFHDLYRNLPGGAEATHWIDDTPFNILHADGLARLFPAMRLVHIHRHPLDVAASYRERRWGGDDVGVVSRRLAGIFRRWFDLRDRLDPEQFTEIPFERLVEAPGDVLAGLSAHIGAEADAGAQAAGRLDSRLAHIGRWRKDLTADEAALCRRHLEFAIDAYGYDA